MYEILAKRTDERIARIHETTHHWEDDCGIFPLNLHWRNDLRVARALEGKRDVREDEKMKEEQLR